jgi:hypothetical protein
VVTDERGQPTLKIAGIPIGFAQVGLTFDPITAWERSWIGTFSVGGNTVQCRILDPISLYREKLCLSERRGSESDRLHLDLVTEYLRYETCQQVQMLATAKSLEVRTTAAKFLSAIQNRAQEVCQDGGVRRRIQRSISDSESLTPQEQVMLQALTSLEEN